MSNLKIDSNFQRLTSLEITQRVQRIVTADVSPPPRDFNLQEKKKNTLAPGTVGLPVLGGDLKETKVEELA